VRHNVALDEDTGSFHHVVFQLGNTALGLHTFPQPPAPDDRFDEHRIGLDHVSFGCANREELQQWRSHLEKLGIEHGGIKYASYGPVCRSEAPTTTPWSSSAA
jgi:glyoxylase I family protein